MEIWDVIFSAAVNGEKLLPKLSVSKNYKHWMSIGDKRRCEPCEDNHGKIWPMEEEPQPKPPSHPNCRCTVTPMQTIQAGTATADGENGADWTLKYRGILPAYYIRREQAEKAGWKPRKWPSNFIPGKMITVGVYKNKDGHLPQSAGREWYEADINYKSGKRNDQRIVWSNDGLVFVTYDHYKTFYEIG